MRRHHPVEIRHLRSRGSRHARVHPLPHAVLYTTSHCPIAGPRRVGDVVLYLDALASEFILHETARRSRYFLVFWKEREVNVNKKLFSEHGSGL